ncbi:hypothetical protein M9H77_14064 [Catharanthus roseus]|uniref:Uncharacterized protein n=1 Tax=Catharanthus roseus TaxID=4058 RepID=A0ACC0BLZ1_CATRO|nr:hypothetical protein M9H77_14064 [Catharanthus roseus]
MRSGLIHVKSQGCLGGQGKYSNEGFDGRHLKRCGSISFTEFLTRKERFHEVKRMAEKEATTTGTTMPDDLALMAIVAGGVRHECVYEVGSEAVYLRVKSSWILSCTGLAPIMPCCVDCCGEWRLPFRNHLVYIRPPLMLDLIRAAMGIGTSTSSPPAPAADSEASASNVVI